MAAPEPLSAIAGNPEPQASPAALPNELPTEVVARHARPVPRYTSYPTVPSWHPMDATQALARLTADGSDPVSIYVHIPFCERLCAYCGCNAMVRRDEASHDRYVAALLREIGMVRAATGARPLAQLHFGGGTPTYLSPKNLATIVDTLRRAYNPTSDADFSIEVDPMVTSLEMLRTLRELGFSRISLGVQTFENEVQKNIERNQDPETSRRVFAESREVGFPSINVDLMYGLPGQTLATALSDAEAAADLGADRIALFGYAHVPQMRPLQKRLEIFGLPQWPARWNMMRAAAATFVRRGYDAIGMDHFAKPHDSMAKASRAGVLRRNFQGYTVMAPRTLLGLGVSAISDVGGAFIQNDKHLGGYYAAIDGERLASEQGFVRTADDDRRRRIIERVMCQMRLDYDEVDAELGVTMRRDYVGELERLKPLADDGLISLTADGFTLTEAGRPLVRIVASQFDAYLSRDPGKRFSVAV